MSGQVPYSTLEIVGGGRDEGKTQTQQGLLPQVSAAENEPHVLPQVGVNSEDYPEAVVPHSIPAQPVPKDHGPTICGLRKRSFWILATIIILIVIGAAVGGGIGGALSSKESSSSDNAPSSNNSSLRDQKSFLPNTYLAAVNYTEDNVEWHRVFYQTTKDGIYQSAWNSSGKTWTVSPVEIKGRKTKRSELFKTPTPITASFYACSSNMPNLTLYFLDSFSRLRQLSTSNPDDEEWSLGPVDSDYNVISASQLASYSCGHPSYPDYSNTWFQDNDNYYNVIDSAGVKQKVDSKLADAGVNLFKPPANSSLTILPHYRYSNTTEKPPFISLFYVNSDKLYEYHYNNTKFFYMRFFQNYSLPPSAKITGFTWGYNDKLGTVKIMQILYTMPDTGGISILYLNRSGDDKWMSTEAADSSNPFQGVAKYSAVAATQAGRVYAVVEDGASVELREWEYSDGENTYKLLGSVNTQVS